MMERPANYLPYHSTGYFSRIVTDYLSREPALRDFYTHTPDIEGIKTAIAGRKQFNTPRRLLAEVLSAQYEGLPLADKLASNLRSLADDNTFTITTAHQPNIFTGPLYFIYKIMHVIKLADELNSQLEGNHFVPVYYMGSEDADLEELGYLNVGGRKLVWQTKQTGAVGRMKVDKALISLIREIHGQTGVLPFGKELNELFLACYREGKIIQQATLELVNHLFGSYGLVIVVPDNARLKSAFGATVEKELTQAFSHRAVEKTIAELTAREYKVQAGGRDINLFYLLDDKRERIELVNGHYEVLGLQLRFSQEEILKELREHPERFSANVILRGAFQETILPNIVFVGGGGELAYWLELKKVFEEAGIPYPMLMLRNSFLLMTEAQASLIDKLGFSYTDIFQDEQFLLNKLVRRETEHRLSLAAEIEQAHALYAQLKKVSAEVDRTLEEHVSSLETRAVKKLVELEKKLLRAERRRFDTQQQQIAHLKESLFPNKSLQERVDNFSLYYAKEGRNWLQKIYDHSGGFNKGFAVVV